MSEIELDMQLQEIGKQDKTKGQNYYSRQFRSVYHTVRKSLVVLNKSRKNVGNEKAVEKTREMLEAALDSLN